MRTELVWDLDDIRFTIELCAYAELASSRLKVKLSPDVSRRRELLQKYLASRSDGRVNATERPTNDARAQSEFLTTDEAADMLGISVGAIAKRCRTGMFAGVARKVRGQWLIPRVDVEAER